MNQEPRRRFYLREFKAISHAISTYEDLNLLTDHLAEGTTRSFSAKGCSVMLLDDREKQLFPISSYGISEEYLSKGPVFVKENQCAFSTGEPVFIDDMQNDPRVQYPEAAAKHGIVSMLSIPIKYKQETIGILRLYYDKPWKVHESDIDSLSVLCEHLGLVIEYHGLKNFLEGVKAAMGSLPLRRLEGL